MTQEQFDALVNYINARAQYAASPNTHVADQRLAKVLDAHKRAESLCVTEEKSS